MNKKFYVILFGILCVSALLLGFSYARESGTNQESFLKQDKEDNLRVIYSDNYLSTFDDAGTDISIINHDRKETDVVLVLEKKITDNNEETEDSDVYYIVNNGDVKKLTEDKIELGTLSNYGSNGDHATYNVKITSKSTDPIYYKISVKRAVRKTLLDIIEDSKNVYRDENNNLRYYGTGVNNYIKFDGITYRIVGEFDGKLRMITEVTDESDYNTALNNGALLSLDDYLYSFATSKIDGEAAKSLSSWLKVQQFWLKDTNDAGAYVASAKLGLYTDDFMKPHNNRYVREIDSNCYYVSGNGTDKSPYEVTYGS